MSQLRCYAYLDRPYDRVRAALHQRSTTLFHSATRAASARADHLATTLRITAAGLELGVDVHIHVREVLDGRVESMDSPATHVRLDWVAARAASLFPAMEATLSALPMSANETQLILAGTYTPPLGAVGNAIDTLAGRRIAEAAVHRFLEDLVEQLRLELRVL